MKARRVPTILAVALALTLPLLGGCAASTGGPGAAAAAPAEDRGSDEPQVVIRTDDPGRVRQAAITLVRQYGGELRRADPDQLLFSKAGKVAGGSSAATVYFVRLTLSPAGPGRVRASASGTARGPRPTGLSDARARTLLMAGLLRLQATVEAGR